MHTITSPRPPATPARPAAPRPRVERRTSRSFETESPPDRLAAWLTAAGFFAVPISRNAAEYGRFGRGETAEGRPSQLIILYLSGSVVIGGPDASGAGALLDTICTPAAETAGMFDRLEAMR